METFEVQHNYSYNYFLEAICIVQVQNVISYMTVLIGM